MAFDGFHNLSRTWPHFTSGRWRHWRVVRTGINDTCRITDRSYSEELLTYLTLQE